jgi:signal-transduction protein with cAMP-binding, CBS, and nucleotidyltransferase domain
MSTRPSPSTRYPDCAPPAFGHAGEHPITVSFMGLSCRFLTNRYTVYNSAVARASADVLKRVPLFAGLDDRELEQIAATMRERRFASGDTVTEEGAGGAGFFVVESGEAEVTVEGQPRGTIKAGDYFGEIALLTGSDRTATITAVGDMVCWGMTPWDFRPLVESNSTIAWKLLTAMADKLK